MKKRNFLIVALTLVAAICLSLVGMPMSVLADGALQTDESGTYLIGTADELFAFAEQFKTTAEADPSGNRTVFSGKLTANIDLNPGAFFAYDHETGLVTVSKGETSYKMGSGMKNTEIGNFHPVYNGICTQEEWDNEDTTDEQRQEWVAEMTALVEALGLRQWTPIGTSSLPYIGFFDGNGYTIDGLYINDKTINYVGLFGMTGNYNYVSGTYDYGEVKNITIGAHSLIVGHLGENKGSTGAVVGKTQFDKISGCTNNATVVGIGSSGMSTSSGMVAGIVGYANNEVKNCVNNGTIVSPNTAGGIAGNVLGNQYQQGKILNCSNYGYVYARNDLSPYGWAGGIAVNSGVYNQAAGVGGTIEGCVNFGYVEGCYAGGVLANGANGAIVRYCANRGDVRALDYGAGLVGYIGREYFTMEGCYNAGTVGLLPYEGDLGFSRLSYPLVAKIYTYYSDGAAASHTVKNCYNDESVCSAENGLACDKVTATTSYSVTPEVFASGEPAYKMGSRSKNGWRQNLPIPEEDGKDVEVYPTIDGTRRVNLITHYCCHKDSKNKEAHKQTAYTNLENDIIDEHTPDASGICSHCGADVRRPEFTVDSLPDAQVGKTYNQTIYLNRDIPMVKGDINAVVSETDDTTFSFEDIKGLTGKADYSYGSKYYYNVSGTPTESGAITFTLVAENDNGVTKKTYTINIKEGEPLAIDTEARLENGTVGESYWRVLKCYTTDLAKTWSLASGSKLPLGLTLGEDGTIQGKPELAGTYTFTIELRAGGQTTQKTFTLVIFGEGGCQHEEMIKIEGKAATCMEDGIADYYHCNICDCDFADSEGKRELSSYEIDNLKTATGHADKNSDGKCDFCNKNMPVFKKQIANGGVVYGGTYIFVTIIGGKYYALSAPTETEWGGREYTELMLLCEITPDANGDFSYTALESKGALMVKTEFAVGDINLDAKIKRYGFSSVLDNTRYGLSSDGMPYFDCYPNESAKYGYRISINDRGEAIIGSIYQEWWSKPETAGRGLLRAFDMTADGKNYKFMTFNTESDYNGEYENYAGATMKDYPIYLYRMVNVGQTGGGVTFVTNDSNGNVGKGDLGLPDITDLSDVNGIANAVSEGYMEALVDEKAAGKTDVTAGLYAEINATELNKSGDTATSVKYSVTPMVDITDKDGNVLYSGEISDSNLSGAPITVTLYAGGVSPAQIIHYKEDGSKEYFYPEGSEKARNGAKSFVYDGGFVTFTIDSFSDIEILATAKAEEAAHVHDYGTLVAKVDATCSATGMQAHYVCSGCGKMFDESKVEKTAEELTIAINPNAHSFGKWVEEVPATTEKTGVKGHKDCEHCHKHFDKDGKEISDLTIEKLPNGGKDSSSGKDGCKSSIMGGGFSAFVMCLIALAFFFIKKRALNR